MIFSILSSQIIRSFDWTSIIVIIIVVIVVIIFNYFIHPSGEELRGEGGITSNNNLRYSFHVRKSWPNMINFPTDLFGVQPLQMQGEFGWVCIILKRKMFSNRLFECIRGIVDANNWKQLVENTPDRN